MRSIYCEEVLEFLRKNSAGISTKELTALINEKFGTNYSFTQIKRKRCNMGCLSGRDTRFGSKDAPPSYDGPHKANSGSFKKGNVSWNELPVGSFVSTPDGYLWVKVKDEPHGLRGNWKQYHILLWEQENGPVPADHVVIFLDGNKRNFSKDNLKLCSRRMNGLMSHNRPADYSTAELREAVFKTYQIIEKVTEYEKQH